MEPPVLELAGVVKGFGGARAVGPLHLAVSRGDSVALVGPSGAGKSTLLRLMLGLVAPDAGEVRRAGRPLDPADHAARRACGYVVQGGGLFPHLTAAGNAALVARHLRWPAARVAARLRELAALARLPTAAMARFPAELSGGQAQRVSLMRALFLDPPLLLLDEPLGALDPITRADLQDDLAQAFRALGKTVVLVTHDLAEAARLASRLVVLREGRTEQDGPLEALLRAPASPFVRRFVRAQRGLPPAPEEA
ncbi:MAG: ATP-binding cassette domain-containing protein [Anaeromyxobacter sp.]